MLGPGEVISGHYVQFVFNSMQYEDFLVVLTCLLFAVVRSKESLRTLHGMGVPLLRSWGEERVSKESSYLLCFMSLGQQWQFFHGRDGPHLRRGSRETGISIPPKGTPERTERHSCNRRFVSRLFVALVIYYGFLRALNFTCDLVCFILLAASCVCLHLRLRLRVFYSTCGFVWFILLAASWIYSTCGFVVLFYSLVLAALCVCFILLASSWCIFCQTCNGLRGFILLAASCVSF